MINIICTLLLIGFSTSIKSNEQFQADVKFTGRMCTHAGGSICTIENQNDGNTKYYKSFEDETVVYFEIDIQKISTESFEAIVKSSENEGGTKQYFFHVQDDIILPKFMTGNLLIEGRVIQEGQYPVTIKNNFLIIKFNIK